MHAICMQHAAMLRTEGALDAHEALWCDGFNSAYVLNHGGALFQGRQQPFPLFLVQWIRLFAFLHITMHTPQ